MWLFAQKRKTAENSTAKVRQVSLIEDRQAKDIVEVGTITGFIEKDNIAFPKYDIRAGTNRYQIYAWEWICPCCNTRNVDIKPWEYDLIKNKILECSTCKSRGVNTVVGKDEDGKWRVIMV